MVTTGSVYVPDKRGFHQFDRKVFGRLTSRIPSKSHYDGVRWHRGGQFMSSLMQNEPGSGEFYPSPVQKPKETRWFGLQGQREARDDKTPCTMRSPPVQYLKSFALQL